MAGDLTAFEKWQKLQKDLHEIERQIAQQGTRTRARGGKAPAPHPLHEQAVELRNKVDALFPAAMQQLEDEVARLSAKRHTLNDEKA